MSRPLSADTAVAAGEMYGLVRAFDWSKTPLGPMDRWPACLRTLVDMLLAHPFPSILLWGPELIQIYNDGFRQIVADKHPAALGQPTYECWPEARHITAPIYEKVLRHGESVSLKDHLVPMVRGGNLEDRFFTVAYTPIRDEHETIAGALVTLFETTDKVLADRERAKAQARYRAIFDATRDGLIINAPDGTIVEANPAACRMHGYQYEQFVGLSSHQVVHPEDLHLFAKFVEVTTSGGDFRAEARDLRRDGTPFPVEVLGSSFNYGGSMHLLGVVRDVSERKKAEQAQAHFAAIVTSSADAIISKALDGVIRSWNAAAQRLFGYAEEEVVGRSIFLLIPEDRRAEEETILARLRQGERIEHYETVRLRKGGAPVEVSITLSPIRGVDGRIIGASKIAREVGVRKQAEAALRAARDDAESRLAQWRAVVASMSEGLVVSDPRGNLLDWNRAALDMHGFSGVEDAGKKLGDFTAHFEVRDADGQAVPMENWPLSRVLRGETFRGAEFLVRRRDGSLSRIISFSGAPVRDSGGNLHLALLTLHDVTDERTAQQALRRSAEHLSLALAAAKLGDWAWDAKTDVMTLSDRAAEIFAVPPGAHATRTHLRDMLHPDDREMARLASERAAAERSDYDVEYRVNRADGIQVWVAAKGRGQYDTAGNVTGMLGVLQDVTERKAAEAERERLLTSERATRTDAERASHMKDEFLATLSHELRTPLNAILGWAQILRGNASDAEDLRQGLETIERNARAQTQIIEDLLDMSRIISGKVRLDVRRVELLPVVEAAIETMRPAADAKGIRLVPVLDPQAGPVSGDPGRLQQIFWNLLSNAIKFTPRRGQVQVVLRRVSSHAEVGITDTGQGIKPEFLPHVFERFRQADASTTRAHGGLGLGLAIVKQLVELHGGTVHAKSAGEGRGASFIVALPVSALNSPRDSHDAPSHPAAQSAAPSARPRPNLKGVRVLVVDDEPDARALIKRLLEDSDAQVATAGSAAEALASIASRPPDVLVSDIGMPAEDGYALIHQLRQLPPAAGGNTPAIALTAYARSEDRQRAIYAGFQMHLAKPVEPSELITMVASLAGRTR